MHIIRLLIFLYIGHSQARGSKQFKEAAKGDGGDLKFIRLPRLHQVLP
jgi:hypothetical protein